MQDMLGILQGELRNIYTLLPEAELCQEENPPSTWLLGMLLSDATTTVSSLWRRELQSCVDKMCDGIPSEASLGPRFLGT